MIQEWTFARQEGACDFECLRMPEFAHLFSLFLNFWLVVLGSGLEQEAHLRTHAEVGHRQYAELAEE